ncbi:hypothetical protein Hanom_Chr00s008961g01742031 [Helianthus anomalus]
MISNGKRIEESVVINWKERRFVVWVSEDFEIWSPDLTGEGSKIDDGDNAAELSDGYSSDGNNEDGNDVMEDLEDGEIPKQVNDKPVPEKDDHPTSEPENLQEDGELPEFERLVNEKSADEEAPVRFPIGGMHEVHREHHGIFNKCTGHIEKAAGVPGPNSSCWTWEEI